MTPQERSRILDLLDAERQTLVFPGTKHVSEMGLVRDISDDGRISTTLYSCCPEEELDRTIRSQMESARIHGYELDGTSVLSRNAVFRAFGRTKRGRSKLELREPNMPSFADAKNLKPFIDKEFPRGLTTISYLSLKGVKTQGYKAEVLPSMCEVYLKALEGGVLTGPQKELAKVAVSLIRFFAKIGIVAWIHEVTGYQYIRDPSALSALVALYIAEEKRKWQLEFRDEFYTHLSRIYGRTIINPKQCPQWMAKFTTKYIYEPLEEGEVMRRLDKVNPIGPKGYRKDKLHSHASGDYGIQRVRERIEGTLTCMKIANNKRKFDSLYARAFPRKEGYQGDWIDDLEA